MSETKTDRPWKNSSYSHHLKRVDTKTKANKVSISTANRITRRVIAPYVRVVRRPHKTISTAEVIEETKQFSYYLQKKPSALMRNLATFLSDSVDLPSLLCETADVLKGVTNASGVSLYMVDEAAKEIYEFQKSETNARHKVNWKIEEGTTIAAYVASRKEFVMVNDILGDERFIEGVGYKDKTVKSVLCVPVMTPDSDCLAVIELYRDVSAPAFNKDELKIVIAVTGWMGAALHQNQQRLALQRQQELNDYLLDLTKCYFADTLIMEKMLTEIVGFAKQTLGAERGAFFIIDPHSDDLIADLFDEGIGTDRNTLHRKNMKIQMERHRGIAGFVAKTGKMLNIRDAYRDPRFNKEIDQKTGYITRSILCMPIMGMHGILGVVQLVNKKNGTCFTHQDENLFKTFSVYCALALHYSNLHIMMNKTDKLNKCYYRLLQQHIKPCHHDLHEHSVKPRKVELPEDFSEFYWYIVPEQDPYLIQYTLHLLSYIIGEDRVNNEQLLEFVLTCRDCYRPNPYHNFHHAFNVCHCMYNILMRNRETFSVIERDALIIAALCHDLDHPGFTNNFLVLTNDYFADLYEESILENHHFDMTMLLLGNTKIFACEYAEEDYKLFTAEIKAAIISTDLANYFKTRFKLYSLINETDSFDWEDSSHRALLKGIAMTSSDLSGQCKPYPQARKITDDVYKEFYNQGDLEKSMGLFPLSMMDRDKQHLVPEDQVQFLTVVVMPCTELLKMILPNTQELFATAKALRDTWKEIIGLRGERCWRQDISVPKSDVE